MSQSWGDSDGATSSHVFSDLESNSHSHSHTQSRKNSQSAKNQLLQQCNSNKSDSTFCDKIEVIPTSSNVSEYTGTNIEDMGNVIMYRKGRRRKQNRDRVGGNTNEPSMEAYYIPSESRSQSQPRPARKGSPIERGRDAAFSDDSGTHGTGYISGKGSSNSSPWIPVSSLESLKSMPSDEAPNNIPRLFDSPSKDDEHMNSKSSETRPWRSSGQNRMSINTGSLSSEKIKRSAKYQKIFGAESASPKLQETVSRLMNPFSSKSASPLLGIEDYKDVDEGARKIDDHQTPFKSRKKSALPNERGEEPMQLRSVPSGGSRTVGKNYMNSASQSASPKERHLEKNSNNPFMSSRSKSTSSEEKKNLDRIFSDRLQKGSPPDERNVHRNPFASPKETVLETKHTNPFSSPAVSPEEIRMEDNHTNLLNSHEYKEVKKFGRMQFNSRLPGKSRMEAAMFPTLSFNASSSKSDNFHEPKLSTRSRSYSRSPSPTFQRPSRAVLKDGEKFHTLLSCGTSPDDPQFFKALEVLTSSSDPRRLAQMKISHAHNWTALHIAALSNPPLYIIYAILLVFPEGAKELDSAGRLPLHLAAGSDTDECVLNTLVRFHNASIHTKDDRGLIPLHLSLLRDSSDEIPLDALRVLLGQTIRSDGKSGIPVRKGTRAIRDGYMRNKEHLNLQLDEIHDGVLGMSRNAITEKERKMRAQFSGMAKFRDQASTLSRGFARNIEEADSQDGEPHHHEHLASLWHDEGHIMRNDHFGNMELTETANFSVEVQRCLKRLSIWKKKHDRQHGSGEIAQDGAPEIMNPATIPAPPHMRLPIHMAVRRNHKKGQEQMISESDSLALPSNQNDLLRVLIHAFPASLLIRDSQHKTPLMMCLHLVHHPARYPIDVEMTELLLGMRTVGFRAAPQWLKDADFFERHYQTVNQNKEIAALKVSGARSMEINPAMMPCNESLPLHIAARESLPPSIVHTIYNCYPGAKYAQDDRNCTPLHCALDTTLGNCVDLDTVCILMDDQVLRARNNLNQSVLDLLVENAKKGKLPTRCKGRLTRSTKVSNLRSMKEARESGDEGNEILFLSMFQHAVADEVLNAPVGCMKEEKILSDLSSLPAWLRNQACEAPAVQWLLLRELAKPKITASILLYGAVLLALTVAFGSLVDSFVSHGPDVNYAATSNVLKAVIFLCNGYLSLHGMCYSYMAFRLNVGFVECVSNVWAWISFFALFSSFFVTARVAYQETLSGHVESRDNTLFPMGVAALGLLWVAIIGYMSRWWFGISAVCSSVIKMVRQLVAPFIIILLFSFAFMQMVYVVHTRNDTNAQCMYQAMDIGESLKICSLWGSFKILYLLIIGEGFIGTEASSDNGIIILLLVFVFLIFILVLHTIAISVLNLQRARATNAMVGSFWSPILTYALTNRELGEMFCCGSKTSEPIGNEFNQKYKYGRARICCEISSFDNRLEDTWDFITAFYSGIEMKDTKWWYLQRNFGPSHLVGKKWFVQIVGLFVLPLWFCLGLVTLGLLWPPQVRRWMFSIAIYDLDCVKSNAGVVTESEQVASLKSDVSNVKVMLYERFQFVDSELHEINSILKGSCEQ